MLMMRQMLTEINKHMVKPLTQGEFFKWLGIQLAMCVEPRRGPIEVYWAKRSHEGSSSLPANYGERFGMSRHRFQEITSALRFTDTSTAANLNEVYRKTNILCNLLL